MTPFDKRKRKKNFLDFLWKLELEQKDVAERFGIPLNTISCFISGKRPNNADCIAAFAELGFTEKRNDDDTLPGGPPIQRRHKVKISLPSDLNRCADQHAHTHSAEQAGEEA